MKPVILVIDDNEEMLDLIKDDLVDKYTVITASTGRDAVHILEAETIHLVVSDIMMPVMDGFELTSHLKTNFDTSHIPVILLTAKNTLQSKIQGAEAGADAYIEKPFSLEYLQAQINNLLNNRNKLKEYFAKSPLAHIKTIAYSKTDEQFLVTLENIIQANLHDKLLDVDKLAKNMLVSRPSLYRKIKSLSNMSPSELITISRLKKAAELLLLGEYKIYEVAEMVGYTSQTNFGRIFLKQFGMTPSDYQKKNTNNNH